MLRLKDSTKYLGLTLALAVAYYATARLGLLFDAVSGFATLIWPPTGIALAALFLGGWRYWPGIALGAFLANYHTGAPVAVALGIALGNTGEALVGAYLLRKFDFRATIARRKDALIFIAVAIASALVSATVGVCSLWFGGVIGISALQETWSAWWIGDVLGSLVVGALVIVCAALVRRELLRKESAEMTTIAVSVAFVGLLVFANPFGGNPPILYLTFVPILWAALRLGQLGNVGAIMLMSVIALWSSVTGFGPFAAANVSQGLLQMQLFIGTIAATALTVSALDAERKAALAEVQSFNRGLEQKVFERTFELSKANEELIWSKEILEKRRAVLQAVLHGIGEGVFAIDTAGNPIVTNPTATKMLGLPLVTDSTPIEKLAVTFPSFYPSNQTPVPIEDLPISRALRGELTQNEQLIMKPPTSPQGILISMTGSPITDDKGNIVGGVVIFREIPGWKPPAS